MQRFLEWFRSSIIRRFFIVFFGIVVSVALVAIPAILLTSSMGSSGGAINVSGSMRMQSYKLAMAVLNPYQTDTARRTNTEGALRDFGNKLSDASLHDAMSSDPADPIRARWEKLYKRFNTEITRLAMASLTSDADREKFVWAIPSFVEDVNLYVKVLEESLNERLMLLKWLLIGILLGSLILTYGMLIVMRRRIFNPLLDIGAVAEAVRKGDLSVRAPVSTRDEIGRLASGFNYMLDELSRLYGNLEAEVARKTVDLNRRNAGLELIGRIAENVTFEEGHTTRELTPFLNEIAKLVGARACALTAGEKDKALMLAKSDAWRGEDELPTNRVTLSSGETEVGELLAVFEQPIEPWQADLLKAFAQTLGRAMDRATRQIDDRRLAVLEERSTIARELHDSIAQSLSFARIQLHRLKLFIERNADHETVLKTVGELNEGLSGAYSQLREVLTAFRLQIGGSGLTGALEESIDEFRNRTGLPVSFTCNLLGFELNPNAQVHLVSIVREGLSNIEKHARASSVSVRVERENANTGSAMVLVIEDDGVGLPEKPGKPNHYGLTIMNERAEAIGGELSISRRTDASGTRLVLRIPEKTQSPAQSDRAVR